MVSVAQAAVVLLGRPDIGSWILRAISGNQTSPIGCSIRLNRPRMSASSDSTLHWLGGISGRLPPRSCPWAASKIFINSCSRAASCSSGVFPHPALQSADRILENWEAGILTWIWSLTIRKHPLPIIQPGLETQAGRSSLVLAKPPELKSKSPLTGQELLQSS